MQMPPYTPPSPEPRPCLHMAVCAQTPAMPGGGSGLGLETWVEGAGVQ